MSAPTGTPGPSPVLAALDAAGLDAAGAAASLQVVVVTADGTSHLDVRCTASRARGRTRPATVTANLDRLEAQAGWCAGCATVPARLATFRLAGVPLAGWLARSAALAAALAAIDGCGDAAAFALAFETLAAALVPFAAHPCPAAELAAQVLGTLPARHAALLDHAELHTWARRWAFAQDREHAPLLPGTTRASLRALGGRAGVEAAFRSWAARRPGHWTDGAWRPWHAHWAQLAATVPLGPPTLVALAHGGTHAGRLEHLTTPTAREQYALELAWLRPAGTVRHIPAVAAALLVAAAAGSHSPVATQGCPDPAGRDVAASWWARGVPMPRALVLAAATVAPDRG